MSVLVVGSAAFDTIETPCGKVKNVVGGSAIYFSISASFFVPVKLVAVVGTDFPDSICRFLEKRNIDLQGLKKVCGKTFRWQGKYGCDLNQAETISTQLNVFSDFSPSLPPPYKEIEYIFLGNIDPDLQRNVISQIKKPKLIACDTMNYWIENKKHSLLKLIRNVDILVINEMETKQLAEESNIVKAGKKIISFGPKSIVIKRGEYGVLYISKKRIFALPAYPLEKVYDPTGAGDSFAGGFVGYLAKKKSIVSRSEKNIYEAIIYGNIMGSFCVEDFSINRFRNLKYSQIKQRYKFYDKSSYI